jgi:hypothetical protein
MGCVSVRGGVPDHFHPKTPPSASLSEAENESEFEGLGHQHVEPGMGRHGVAFR